MEESIELRNTAHCKGQVEHCEKVFDDLKNHMIGLIKAYLAEKSKSKNNKVKKEIGKSKNDDAPFINPDLEAHIPSFEDSSSFPIRLGDELLALVHLL